MWTSFEISNRPTCSKFNLLSFDIGVAIDKSSKVKSYKHFSESNRYNLNAFPWFRTKFSKYSHSMQMELGQVNYHTILTLETWLYIVYIHPERRTVPLKVLPLTWGKNIWMSSRRGRSFRLFVWDWAEGQLPKSLKCLSRLFMISWKDIKEIESS